METIKSTPRTSAQWWADTKSDPQRLNRWLRRQYVGEMAAVNLLSELLIKYGHDATPEEWRTVHKIMMQEALHAQWVKGLLDARGLSPEPNASTDRRYWAEVLPNVTNFAEAMAAGFHAESMRLERIRVIAGDEMAPQDVRQVFIRILPHEEWHEEAFDTMRKGREISRYHERGLQALNLLMA
jgi:hypothetical protein